MAMRLGFFRMAFTVQNRSVISSDSEKSMHARRRLTLYRFLTIARNDNYILAYLLHHLNPLPFCQGAYIIVVHSRAIRGR